MCTLHSSMHFRNSLLEASQGSHVAWGLEPCVERLSATRKARALGSDGVEVVGIAQDESEPEVPTRNTREHLIARR